MFLDILSGELSERLSPSGPMGHSQYHFVAKVGLRSARSCIHPFPMHHSSFLLNAGYDLVT